MYISNYLLPRTPGFSVPDILLRIINILCQDGPRINPHLAPNLPLLYKLVEIVEPSPVYSGLYQFPKVDTSRTTIHYREMSNGQTVKPL